VPGNAAATAWHSETSMFLPPFLFNVVDSFLKAVLFLFVFGLVAILYRMVT
jgi:hypothetical protein